MRGVSKSLLALAVMALLALGLSACGGGEDSTGSTATTTQEGATTTPSAGGSDDQGQEQGGGKGEGQGDGSDDAAGSDDSSGSDDGADASDEGSASFRVPGGDNSIQNYGEEPDESEFEAAEAVLTDFLEARAKGNWAGMCDALAAAAIAPLEELAKRSPQLKGQDCPALLKALLARGPAASRANTMTDGLASLRVEGDRAFALYHGPEGGDYFVPLIEEDGEWKVGSLAPSEFP